MYYIDRIRADFQKVWGEANYCLYALPGGTGAGPAVWCHGLIPDYHAFRGSYGGYAFLLNDQRPTVNDSNLSSSLIESLCVAYGEAITSEDLFDAILALLSASTYAGRFAEDLEDVFPHIPFPARPRVFREAARLGREIRGVETFSREPATRYRHSSFLRLTNEPSGEVGPVEWKDSEIVLCADGTGRITGLPKAVWDFAVSGYRLLPRWIEGRKGLPADLAFVTELRDVAARIAELLDLFAQGDIVLEATLRETLTREALGLPAMESGDDDRTE